MMQQLKILLPIILLFTTGFTISEKTCVIKGTVIDRNSKAVYLIKAYRDARGEKVRIPIEDGSFEHKLNFNESEAYSLIFEDELKLGAYRPVIFFPTEGKIQFKLYPHTQFSKNQIIGGALNEQYDVLQQYMYKLEKRFNVLTQHLQDSLSSLNNSDNYFNESMKNLQENYKKAQDQEERSDIFTKMERLRKSNSHLTIAAGNITNQLNAVVRKLFREKYEFLLKSPSIPAYYLLLEDAMMFDENTYDLDIMKNFHNSLIEKFKNHPYNLLTLETFHALKGGGQFIDFKLPDVNGQELLASEVIRGKIALINIWAPWCGPCLQKSRNIIPVFNDYKERGFTVLGVVGQFDDFESAKRRIEKENYPWTTLVEYKTDNSLWNKYGIPNSGGGLFLIDKKGKILAKDPTAEEIRMKLIELL